MNRFLIAAFAIIWMVLANLSAQATFPFPITPPSGIAATYTYNTRSLNVTGGQTTYTFTALNIGSADPTRFVVIGISARDVSLTISSVTIGGSTATLLKSQQDPGPFTTAAFYGLSVPSGTTADVVVNFGGSGPINCAVVSYSLYNLNSTTPVASASANLATTGTALSLNANTTTGSIVLGLTSETAASATVTWVGATKRFDEAARTNFNYWSGADDVMVSSESPRTFTATLSSSPTGGASAVLIVMK
jgi:hypothetical protein